MDLPGAGRWNCCDGSCRVGVVFQEVDSDMNRYHDIQV